jgi:diacylglycerol kinase family enzyme
LDTPSPPQRKTGLITNPYSRRNRTHRQALASIVADHPNILHRVTEHPEQLAEVLREFAAAGVRVLAINGGDGTSARVFTALLQQRPFAALPSLALLPGGSTNVNANDVGLRGGLQRAARSLASWARGAPVAEQRVTRHLLCVRGAVQEQPQYGMFFGAGSVVRGIEYCQRTFYQRGIANAFGPALAIARVAWGMFRNQPRFASPTPMRVELAALDEASAPREVLLMMITSLDHLILGMRPYWGGETGALHCTWIEKPAHGLLRAMPHVLRGRPDARVTPEHGYLSHNASQARLWLNGTFTVDGEMHQADSSTPLTVSTADELEFLRLGRLR